MQSPFTDFLPVKQRQDLVVSEIPDLERESPFVQETDFESESDLESESLYTSFEADFETDDEAAVYAENETSFTEVYELHESEVDVVKAERNNHEYSEKLLWKFFKLEILQLLGHTTSTPGAADFAHSVADWQSKNDIQPSDGMIGSGTWSRMFKAIILRSSFKGINIDKAILANRRLAVTAGWDKYRLSLYEVLGFYKETPNETMLVKAIALWQRKLGDPKSADGRLGQNSWDLLKPFVFAKMHDSGAPVEKTVNYAAIVRAPKGIYLHKKPNPTTKQTTKLYPQGHKLIALAVSTITAEWGWVKIRTEDGNEGWIEDRYIIRFMPDDALKALVREPFPYIVQPGDTLDALVKKYYGDYPIELGNDRRTIIHAFSILNDDTGAIDYKGESDTWWRDHVLDRDMAETRRIYQTIRLRPTLPIYFPNEAYIRMLRDRNIVGVRPEWKNVAITIGKSIAGFLEGVVKGFASAAVDTVTGLWDLIKNIFTGELFKQVYNIYKEFVNAPLETLEKVWDFMKSMVGEGIDAIKNDFASKDPYRKLLTIGKIVGYILFEVVLAVLTMGAGTAAKLATKGAKALGLLDKFISLSKVVNKARPALKTTRTILDKVEDGYSLVVMGDAAIRAIRSIDEFNIAEIDFSKVTNETEWEEGWETEETVEMEHEDLLKPGSETEDLVMLMMKEGDPELVRKGIPPMGDIFKAQHSNNHGIDLIGFTVHNGKVRIFIVEVKGGKYPKLGTPNIGTQGSAAWISDAIDQIFEKNKPLRDQLIQAFKEYHGERPTLEQLKKKLMNANRKMIVSKAADPGALERLKKSLAHRRMRRMKLITREVELSTEISYEEEINASSLLTASANAKATQTNQQQLTKSGISASAILSVIARQIDINSLRQLLASQNYSLASQADTADALFTEATHQFQRLHFINPKEHDGVLGASTMDTLGFKKHGLRPKLNSTGFYGQTQLNRSDVKPLVPAATNNEFTAANWYEHIIRPAWLGVKISDGVHVLLMEKLRRAESWLLNQPQYKGMTPAALGMALGFTASTRYSAARLSSNKQAMHGFGLAIDIHVVGNPWIGAGWIVNDKVLLLERFRMIGALRKASGIALPGGTVFEYLNNIAQSTGGDTAKAYGILKKRNDEFVAFLKNNSTELNYWTTSATFGNRNPLNGFLNLHPDLVYALRHVAGLAWGAIDFGPRASGDIMHFDLRTIGVGKLLCEKIGGFVPKSGHPAINKEIDFELEEEREEEVNEFVDESEFHEAIEEAEWTDETEIDNYFELTAEDENYAHDLEDYEHSNDHKDYEDNSAYEGYSLDSYETLTKDWTKAVIMNRQYAISLGWDQYITKINELLLPYSGYQSVSLGEEAFAQAVAAWQEQQGFSGKNADGIIGPNTWSAMKPLIMSSDQVSITPTIPTATMPSIQNIADFNKWHAQKILDSMNNGIIGQNFKSKDQLEKIAGGEQVLFINPRTQLIKILPVIYHIAKQAQSENYKEIIIGSFIRGANKEGKCTGHCAGRCVDINYRGGNFETAGSVEMVKKILSYLISLPAQYKKSFGFGMPLQGSFFGDKSLTKFKSTLASNLANADLQQLVLRMGIVFPDNDNHLHIQVNWEVNRANDQETAAERNNIFLPAI